jgi:hypothetical protein
MSRAHLCRTQLICDRAAPVASECDTTVTLPTFTCRVTYQDVVVTCHVTTTPKSADTFTWQARPDRIVATRAGIEAAMWRAYPQASDMWIRWWGRRGRDGGFPCPRRSPRGR